MVEDTTAKHARQSDADLQFKIGTDRKRKKGSKSEKNSKREKESKTKKGSKTKHGSNWQEKLTAWMAPWKVPKNARRNYR